MIMQDVERINRFWLDEIGPKGWYAGGPDLDADITSRFADLWHMVQSGDLSPWPETAQGAFALLILLDQFPRNMFRDTAKAFASDSQALIVSAQAIQAGFDMDTPEPQRQFFYLPLMHSEDLADQERCVHLIETRLPQTGASNVRHARAHRDVIRQFRRFPYRNAALGRTNSPAEDRYLAAGGYRISLDAV